MSQAESPLGGALGRLFAVAEAYPDLKANQNMLSLQEELTSTENKIGFARQAYNDAVMDYNTQREVFPTVMVASMFGFTEAALLEIAEPSGSAQGVVPVTRNRRRSVRPCSRRSTDHGHRLLPAAGYARRQTGRLIVYFVLAVVTLIALRLWRCCRGAGHVCGTGETGARWSATGAAPVCGAGSVASWSAGSLLKMAQLRSRRQGASP